MSKLCADYIPKKRSFGENVNRGPVCIHTQKDRKMHVKDPVVHVRGSRDSLSIKRQTRDRQVASSNPGRGGGRIFFFKINFVC